MPPLNHLQRDTSADHILSLFSQITDASDRVAAITGAAFLDNSIGAALAAKFVRLGKQWEDRIFSGSTAPLSTFSGKARIGYALGLFGPKTFADLEIIRKIRNEFAHTASQVSFDDVDIKRTCTLLSTPAIIEGDWLTIALLGGQYDFDSPRNRYIASVRHISIRVIEQTRKTTISRPVFPDVLP